MSHIHVPDGIIPLSWGAGGYVVSLLIMILIIRSMDAAEARQRIPATAMAAAIMIIGMSVPLFVVPVHLSLAVLTGILVGPKMGFLAVFVVNLILASFGHGGITIVGLNTLLIGSEVLVGSVVFKGLKQHLSVRKGAFGATMAGVALSMVLMVLLVGSTAGFSEVLPHHHHGEHDELPAVTLTETQENEPHGHSHQHGSFHEELERIRYFTFTGWAAVGTIFLAGLMLEAAGTSLIVGYFQRVKPQLIDR
ncbi:energy-coupling factor ABC transporter permease [Anoxynatronum buryatiense]|uniref:Cobalt/nickel transport system permease protein n=1 Tax=Anoxynatronum buryatiense TaxID=489973 RepID=A0AA46AHL8_9CLOT|nr:energy-coupling factor ABC transporter permease [Anoxynatronum buryatiense]SMP40333.1 cobalt/nickel transport system permease protein [Anoxynatronum buryatiense]